MKKIILLLSLFAFPLSAQINLSIGARAAYNGQFNGTGGWPNNGRYMDGDSGRSTWCSDGTTYVVFNDGIGPNGSLSGGRNIFLASLSDNFTGPSGGQLYTVRNSMDIFGTITQNNTNGWTDGKNWKTDGLHCQNGAMYMSVYRLGGIHNGNGSLMKSLDNGATWCSPSHTNHTTGACTITPSATGDAPTNGQNMLDFTGMRGLQFVQYAQDGGTGPSVIENNDTWTYMYLQGDLVTDIYAMRVRNTDLPLLDETKYQFYRGAGSCTDDASWSTSQSDKVSMPGGTNIISNVMYIPSSGYYVLEGIALNQDAVFAASRSACGPFKEIGRIPYGGDPSQLQAWFSPVIKTMSTSTSGVTTMLWISGWAVGGRTGNPATNLYSQYDNLLTFTSPPMDLRQDGATPREVITRYYTDWPSDCTFEVSESPTFSPLVNDVNTALFAGSNSDFRNGAQGRDRTFVIGAAGLGINYAPVAADGRKRSRALQTNTTHYYRRTCGTQVSTGTVRTANIATGDTFPMMTMPIDPSRKGEVGWPFLPWDSSGGGVIDPVSGVYIQAIRKPNERAQSTGNPGAQGFQHIYDDSNTWTNESNIGSTADGVSATTTANNPLRLYSDISYNTANATVVGLQLVMTAMKDASGTTAEVCLSIDGATCFGPWIPITLNTGTLASTTVGDVDGQTASMLSAWISTGQRVPNVYELKGSTGFADNVGNTVTLRVGSNGAFNTNWTTGTHFVYDGTDYSISAVNSGTEIVISGSPANASSKVWSSANFGFHIRKSSGGGTLTIDSAAVQYLYYASHQTNGGSGSTLPCTETRYHDGWRIGGPTGIYTNAATNASPIVIRTTSNHDFVTGDIVKVYGVPGNTAANGTWTVTVVDSNHFSLNTSNGTASGAFPSDADNSVGDGGGGLVYRTGGPRGAAPTGALCFMLDGEGIQDWYWMNPDTTPVDMRFLGPMYVYPHHGQPGQSTSGLLIDTGNPDYPTTSKVINVSGTDELWSGKYIGNQTSGMFHDVGTQTFIGPNSDVFEWHSITPSPNTFQSKILAFDPNASEQSFGLVGEPTYRANTSSAASRRADHRTACSGWAFTT
jgi:hypothetical protein